MEKAKLMATTKKKKAYSFNKFCYREERSTLEYKGELDDVPLQTVMGECGLMNNSNIRLKK